jgi:ribosome-associated toxin RatA of RatAB toxin-antitoxin module
MTTLHNRITVNASVESLWAVLADLEELDKYDPTVKSATIISSQRTGLDAARKVLMRDGKNWFEEKVTEFEPGRSLCYQLTDCSFPIKGLRHSYRFKPTPSGTEVEQVMEYTVKFGLLGKLMDRLMIRKQTEAGIKKFFIGLKEHVERRA